MKKSPSIGFIGAGNMAEALISGMIRKGYPSRQIFAYDSDPNKVKKLKNKFKIVPLNSNKEVMQRCRQVVLAIKPQNMREVFIEIAPYADHHLIISIAAGIDWSTLSKNLKGQCRIVRTMPNNPALIGEGITALYSKHLSRADLQASENIFRGAGEVLWVKKESELDIVTGLSGSGPAYLYKFVEALAQAGEKLGLRQETAYRLALKTTVGSALTLQKTGKQPKELIPLVASKRGTTLAALSVLEKGRFNKLIEKTVSAATKRAREIRGS
jgi:pyrroline-5-carboxylate reductase